MLQSSKLRLIGRLVHSWDALRQKVVRRRGLDAVHIARIVVEIPDAPGVALYWWSYAAIRHIAHELRVGCPVDASPGRYLLLAELLVLASSLTSAVSCLQICVLLGRLL